MKSKLKDNEEVILTIRKHWFVLIKPILWALILLTIGGLGYYYYQAEFGKYFLILIGLIILWFVYKIFNWRNNLWTVTNLRVIDEYGVFSHNSKETPLDKINNVSYKQPLLGRIFNYGDIQIQSAAEAGSTIQKMVQRPKLLKDTITEYQENYKQEQIKEQAQKLANVLGNQTNSEHYDIYDELTKLNDLKEKGIITEEEFQKRKELILNK